MHRQRFGAWEGRPAQREGFLQFGAPGRGVGGSGDLLAEGDRDAALHREGARFRRRPGEGEAPLA